MKYMTFPASCSFCCIANILEQYNVDVTDREIVVGAGLPYVFRYDVDEDMFSTGAMLQQPRDYNRFLQRYGLYFAESIVSKENMEAYLLNHIPCMVGLLGEYGKHAMVFVAYEQGKYRFLNPHRENDNQKDFVLLSREEMLERLSEENYVGYLVRENIAENSLAAEDTLEVIYQYRERFISFCNREQTGEEVRNYRDSIFRPVALDLPIMMTLIGENALAEKFSVLQSQIFDVMRQVSCIPADIVDLELFTACMDEYQKLICSQ